MQKKWIYGFILVIAGSSFLFVFLIYNGYIWFNNPSFKQYPIQGIDVSSYQGEIDWNMLSSQSIDFAFIKATEGSSFQDAYFSYNWENASKTNLRIGAYHFFSFDSSGITQAENFISVVPQIENMLPPVIDIEFYADKAENPPSKEEMQNILNDLLKTLEKHYHMKPILYVTKETYEQYIKNSYLEYDIWFRNIISLPNPSDERNWTFWQYSNRGRLKGYQGKEKFIDKNVFFGTKEQFENYPFK